MTYSTYKRKLDIFAHQISYLRVRHFMYLIFHFFYPFKRRATPPPFHGGCSYDNLRFELE